MRRLRPLSPAVGHGAGFVSGADAERICAAEAPLLPRAGERRQPSPEETLWSAVLHEALALLHGPASLARAEAEVWVHNDGEHRFGFRWVCAHLQLDPTYVRTHVDRTLARRLHANAGSRTTCKEEAA